MCGILGFNWNDDKLAKKLGSMIRHRGPDGEGYYSDDSITLGHRRLSIIDLSKNGKQPMSNENKDIWITFNGEIFNFNEIREELEKKGHIFSSKTDTEVIVHGYEEWGVRILEKLDGQFAFCIYDGKKLFLARDRLGILPLYYYFKDGKFIFGSELKVIMGAGIKKEIDKDSFNHYLLFGYTPYEKTILKDCYKLPPAHYLVFDIKAKRMIKKRYWNLNFKSDISNESTAAKIKDMIDDSVKRRMISDVPLGAFLSGGLDSSLIVAFASRYSKNLNTFSIKFDIEGYDESKYAKIVSKKFKTRHHVISFGPDDVRDIIKKVPYHFDDPLGDQSMIPTFLVALVARKHVTVSLSGDGGDELFGGYTIYKYERKLKLQRFIPRYFFNIASRFVNKGKLGAFFEIGSLEEEEKYGRLMSYLAIDDFKNLTGNDPKRYYKAIYHSKGLSGAIGSDINNYLHLDILAKVDRASMANSLESRPPLLDHHIVEMACMIDEGLKLKGNEGKYILKKAAEGILPDNIIYRKKKGFSIPLEHYLKNDLKDLVKKYFYDYSAHELINRKSLKKIENNPRAVWAIMMFNMWHERWMAGKDV